LHKYLYAYQNPTVYVDPNGMCSVVTVYDAEGNPGIGCSSAWYEDNALIGAGLLAIQGATLGTWPRDADDQNTTLPIFGGVDLRWDWASANMEAARENRILGAIDTVKNIKSGKGIIDGAKNGITTLKKNKQLGGSKQETRVISESDSDIKVESKSISDPVGTSRDKNGALHGKDGRFVNDPNKPVKKPGSGEKIENKAQGDRRELETEKELQSQYPDASVQREQYLRDSDGNIVRDPVTGEGRRIDHVVIEDGNVIDSVETTSINADKTAQTNKEIRIRESGGEYIRDRDTGCLEKACNTRIIRRD